MQQDQLIPHLYRTEYRKIIAVLARLFGFEHIQIAEDIASDTFLLASETWGKTRLPDNPAAWLYTVAKNKAKDYLKHNAIFNEKVATQIKNEIQQTEDVEIDLSEESINDSQLQMMFAICQPLIPAEAQIGLALRILCGFGIDEIADAFLSNKETINKRLFRAKEKLREQNVKIEFPDSKEINKRLDTVLLTLYLLFNEGYYSSSGNTNLRRELCLEAMRLNYLLIQNHATDLPIVNALFSLMCFHASRFDARMDKDGEIILYDDQDSSLWNDELISRGTYYLVRGAKGPQLTRYHIEATIAYWHTQKQDSPEKWDNVLQLYNKLLILEYSPMAALNRTYALAKARGKAEAIIEAEKLTQLADNHLYHSLLAHLYTGIDQQKALQHLQSALKLTKNQAEKNRIKKNIEELEN
ncbi:sigma-70 family RNA polymerase sigma factor [Mucilaginibacter corticis]|uniref:Sigma-70 family RNA polymerase sigma factor n=1 Tax=Mucilaginibacter corticis TaxID=2597670 RepID=A0A556MVY7_9SPHI|nr:sigma-70 family RNA polymerase sigma factor [Mucilaginibacter corticis]TSJ44032.1 sigma-70 family RNA polymerase sigma factor [Mucilaginibacter corticis]